MAFDEKIANRKDINSNSFVTGKLNRGASARKKTRRQRRDTEVECESHKNMDSLLAENFFPFSFSIFQATCEVNQGHNLDILPSVVIRENKIPI